MKRSEDLPLPTRILQAAFITFGERGYDKSSMDEVAAIAATTKRTVYAHFGNKETLFRAAIAQAVSWFLSELPQLDPKGDLEAELTQFASRFSDLSTWRRPVLLQRVVIAESDRLPDLGEKLHHDVIRGAEQRIADFLLLRCTQDTPSIGQIDAESALSLARIFLNMTTGPQRFATLMEARKPLPTHPTVGPSGLDNGWVRLAVHFFLTGLAGMTPPPEP